MKLIVACILTVTGCGLTTFKVSAVKVEPIHMTIDVNVHDELAEKPSGDDATRHR